MKKVKIIHDSKAYFITPVGDNPRQSTGGSTDFFMYRVEDEDGEIVGCLTFNWSRTARAVASEIVFNNTSEEEITYLALIPHLPFYFNFISKLYTTCFHYMFNTMTDGLEADNSGYNIKVQDGFMRTMQRIIFSGQPTDDQIRKQVLLTLNSHRIESPGEYLHINLLRLFIPVDQKSLTRNLLFLHEEGFIDCKTLYGDEGIIVSHTKILNPGIKHIEGSSEFSKKFPSEFIYQKVMGDNISASTSGSNSPVIIKSKNISIAFEEIEAEIKKTDVSNKQEILVLFDQLKQEITQKNDPEKVKGLLGEIKKKGSWLNEKILSHPLLAQLIAQVLAKAAGIV
jgi:hypothetical protein